MTLVSLIFKELLHRKGNFLLSALALVCTVGLFVGYFSMAEASRNETRRVTRDMGFNIRIIPRGTDMDRFWAEGYSDLTMAEKTLDQLAAHENVFMSYNHLVATLQKKFFLEGKEVLLTGVSPTVAAQGKKPMGYSIKPGTIEVGFRVAERLNLQKNESLTLNNHKFKIVRCGFETGTEDDIRIFGSLADIQKILGLEAQINEIQAIDCLCLLNEQEPLTVLRAELQKALPEAEVLLKSKLADARARQRQMVDRVFGFLTPFLLVVCASWIALLAVLNVRDRRPEIGILRALGKDSGKIAGLFIGKSVLIGLLGALLGFAAGTALAVNVGPDIFKVTAKSIKTNWSLLTWSLLAAPLFAAAAGFIPAMLAVAQDPAESLREE